MNRFILAASLAQADVTEADLANDQASTQDVLTNGMGRHLQRYSPLDTLSTDNVQNLMPAWAFSFGGEKQRGQKSQPLLHDGMMDVCDRLLQPHPCQRYQDRPRGLAI